MMKYNGKERNSQKSSNSAAAHCAAAAVESAFATRAHSPSPRASPPASPRACASPRGPRPGPAAAGGRAWTEPHLLTASLLAASSLGSPDNTSLGKQFISESVFQVSSWKRPLFEDTKPGHFSRSLGCWDTSLQLCGRLPSPRTLFTLV